MKTNQSEPNSYALISISEAAKRYNIGEATLRRLTRDENCPFVMRVGVRGGWCRIVPKLLEEYLASHER